MKTKLLTFFTFVSLPLAPLSVQAQEPKKHTATDIPIAVGKKLDATILPKQWINGEPVQAFEEGVVYVIDLWMSPKKGRRVERFYRRAPGYHHTEERAKYAGSPQVQFFSICINGEKDRERLSYFLSLPEFATEHPSAVALDAFEGTVVQHWVKPSKIAYMPYSLVLKGDRVIWHGESDTMHKFLLEEAVKPDFSIEKMEKIREQDTKRMRDFFALQRKLGKAKKEGATKEQMLQAVNEAKGKYPAKLRQISFADMFCYIHQDAGDKLAAIGALQNVLDQYPGDVQVLQAVLKTLNLKIELRPESEALREKVLVELGDLTGPRYASSCWRMVAEIRQERGDTEGAIEAYQSSVDVSRAAKKLQQLKAGETPPLTQ